MNYTLKDLLDVPRLRELLDALDELHSMPSAIIETDGNVLTASGWQDICTKFHRVNPDTKLKCLESDRHIEAKLGERSPHVVYRCPMGLIDSAVPIVVEGKHLGNVFTGQLFMEPPDEAYFVKQAQQYGFDENEYLVALRKVSLLPEEKLHRNLTFIQSLTQLLAEQGLHCKRECEAKEALREAHNLARLGQWDLNFVTGKLTWSDNIYELLEVGREDVIPSYEALLEFVHPEDRGKLDASFRTSVESKTPYELEHRLLMKDGSIKWILELGRTEYDEDGNAVRSFGTSQDITERKLAEEVQLDLQKTLQKQNHQLNATEAALRTQISEYEITQKLLKASEEKFSALLNNTKIQLWAFDGTSYTYTNMEWFDYTGQSSDSPLTIERWVSAVHPEDLEKSGKIWMANWETKTEHDNYFRLRRHDGVYRDFYCHAVPIFDDQGAFQYFQGFNFDITERKQSERDLLESNSYLNNLITYANAPIIVWDPHFCITRFNHAFELLSGRSENDVLGHSLELLFPPELADQSMELIHKTLTGEQWKTVEIKILHCDGTVRTVLWNSATLFSQDGLTPVATIAQGHDITLRRLSEEKLRRNEEKQQAMIKNIVDVIAIIDRKGISSYLSPNMEKLFGWHPEEVVGESFWKIIHAEDRKTTMKMFTALLSETDKSKSDRCRLQCKDGSFKWIRYTAINQLHEQSISGILLSFHDITELKQDEEERKKLEQQFHHAQKLESLGVMAGGIAHDFNNILSIILGHCHMVKEKLIPEQHYTESFAKIETAANRAADLCQQMLSYAGKNPLSQKQLNLSQLVYEVVKMLHSAIKKNVTIERDLPLEVAEINGDSGQLQQVVMNLIINAAEAIGDNNGTIKVSLTKSLIKTGQTVTDTFGILIYPGSYACLEVADTGSGMDEETQKRIFEPFYTTKFTGRGLGMSAIQGIVKAHEGKLLLASTKGIGTTFKVFFPLLETSCITEAAEATPLLSPAKMVGGTVLLVDDEESLRNIGGVLLEAMGFTVLMAQHGREAIDIYQSRSSEIDIIILDVIMPVMGGIEAYRKLRKIAPLAPIAFCSGFSIEPVQGILDSDENARFVNKPYDPKELRTVLMAMNN